MSVAGLLAGLAGSLAEQYTPLICCSLLQAARSCKLPAPARAARCQPQCTDLNTTVLFLDSRSWSFPQVAGKGSLGKACRRGSSGGKPKM